MLRLILDGSRGWFSKEGGAKEASGSDFLNKLKGQRY
jgi:hypothetical protein